MAKSVATDSNPVTALLVSRTIELERDLTETRRELDEARKFIKVLEDAMDRPAIAMFDHQQVHQLAELVFQRIMGFPIKKDATKPDA